jgi:collagenase-like PrtC family protease
MVFGRTPLALSVRCYHARVNKLHKDNCRFVCKQDPDGMKVNTLTGEPVFAVNGIQTLSFSYNNLIGELDQLRGIGVRRFRLSPHDTDMVAVARTFRNVLDGAVSTGEAQRRLSELMPAARFSNGFFHHREGVAFVGGDAASGAAHL